MVCPYRSDIGNVPLGFIRRHDVHARTRREPQLQEGARESCALLGVVPPRVDCACRAANRRKVSISSNDAQCRTRFLTFFFPIPFPVSKIVERIPLILSPF